MTCREWIKKFMPDCVDDGEAGGVLGCPNQYDLADEPPREYCRGGNCSACWDREVTNQKLLEEESGRVQKPDENPVPGPCPFCNSMRLRVRDWPIPASCQVECQSCSACGPVAESPEEAVDKWNTAYRF